MAVTTKIPEIVHPEYRAMISDWEKFRSVFEGGTAFSDDHLKYFSTRETTADFNTRKTVSYIPAFSKSAVYEMKNAVHQRMVDVIRKGGTSSYQAAIAGDNRGVDLAGNSMNGFIGRLVIPELLSMARVGVYIDRFSLNEGVSLLDIKEARPYTYVYKTEDIRSWAYNNDNQLIKLLLRDTGYKVDENTGLTIGEERQYRLLSLMEDGVNVKIYDHEGIVIDETLLNLPAIPFVFFEISSSLLTDIADHQISLLNLASSDMSYVLKSNFPFYTEQFDPISDLSHIRQATETEDYEEGQEATEKEAKTPEIHVGSAQGRRYPKGLDRPGFIHPPSEPLKASMEKQEQIKREIRRLIHLNVAQLEPRRASAESKQQDEKGLEAGLSAVGLELEYGERLIAAHWSNYEHQKVSVTVQYPKNYSLRSDDDRRLEAKNLQEIMDKVPSLKFQRELAKEIIDLTVGNKVTTDDIEVMKKEVDKAVVVVIDPKVIASDLEQGLVTKETASVARLYPEGEVEKAKKEHEERAAAIAAAQSRAGARGVPDLDDDPSKSGPEEKARSRNTDPDPEIKDKTRGEGK